jgi:hypothetical protein
MYLSLSKIEIISYAPMEIGICLFLFIIPSRNKKHISYGLGGLWMSNKSLSFYNYLKLQKYINDFSYESNILKKKKKKGF